MLVPSSASRVLARRIPACLLLLLLVTAAWSQQRVASRTLPGNQQQVDDVPDPKVLRQLARTPQSRPEKGGQVEQDDATLRREWDIHTHGVASAEFKSRVMRIRRTRSGGAALTAAFEAGMDASPSPASAGMLSAQPSPTWVSVGPSDADYEQNGGYGIAARDSGRARVILPHPTDPETVYFLASGGGLWVTNNFSANPPAWRPLTDSNPTTGGGSVAFGRTPDVLYLGLGDPFDVINIGGAMMKSTDGGQTWTNFFELGAAQSVRDIKVDTSGPQDIVLVSTDTGMFRSTDSGVTYSAVASGPGETFQGKALWHMVRSSAGYLVEGQACTLVPATFCATAGVIYVSTDLGATWAPIPNQSNVFSGAGRATLAVAAEGDAQVYALAAKTADNDQLDLFRSSDGGLDWVNLGITAKAPTNPNDDNPNMDILHGQAWYNQLLLVDPRDQSRNTIYIGGNLSAAKSTDGGATWSLISNWLYDATTLGYAHADFHAAVLKTTGATPTLIFGNDGGMYVSNDDGVTWSSAKNTGLDTYLLYNVAATPRFPGAMMVGAQDNGTRVRKGMTRTFNQSIGGDGTGNGWSQANGAVAIGSASGSAVRKTLNTRVPDVIATWEGATPLGITDSSFYTPIAAPTAQADPTGKIFFMTTSTRIWRTNDGGVTWTIIGQAGQRGIPTTRTMRSAVHGVAVSPVDLYHVASVGNAGTLVLTLDAGSSWLDKSLNTLVPGFQSFVSSVTWADNATLYITSEAPTPNAVRVAKSVDSGATWTRADSGLPDVQAYRLVVDPRDATKSTLLVASALGVYRSTDGGANWAPYGSGLPNVRVSDLYMPPDGSFLLASTYGRGLWELPSLVYASSALTDDGLSCDADGVLDNGETGHLSITLHNDGAATLSSITGTVTSSNPNVTFPNGNAVTFPTAAANGNTTSSITVALNGAVGIQRIDFNIAFNDPALAMSSAITAPASFRANYDEVPFSSTNDDIEAEHSSWTVSGTAPQLPNIFAWERRQIGPTEHRWSAIDSGLPTHEYLTSPAMHVGAGVFTFSFQQHYRFEFVNSATPSYIDGMVLEVSTNNGTTWTDVSQFTNPGYDHTLLVTNSDNALAGRPAFSGYSVNNPDFLPVTLNFGTQFAGQDLRLRFHVSTDTGGAFPGVEIRNITTTGLTDRPFAAVIPHRGSCPSAISVNSTGDAVFGQNVGFVGTVTGGVNPASGTVNFKDGTAIIGSGAIATGQAQFSTSALTVGQHQITAEYPGDASHAGSVSGAIVQNIAKAATTTAVAASQNPSAANATVTFTATIAAILPGVGNPSGTVQFVIDGVNSGPPVPVFSSVATTTVSALVPGNHTVAAIYGGDGNFNTSSGALNGGEVVHGPPTFDVIATPQTVAEGSAIAIHVSATDPEGDPITITVSGTPTGATFVDHANGTADFAWSPTYTQSGTYPLILTASDGTLSSSKNVVVVVSNTNRVPGLVVSASTPQTVAAGTQLIFTVTGSDPDSDPVTISASGLPTGATFTGTNPRTFTWTPSPAQAGISIVGFQVSDGSLSSAASMAINVTVPQSILTQSSLDFGTVITGLGSQPGTFVVMNGGGAVMNISAIQVTGDFAQTSNCATTLVPGTFCTVSVRFLPTVTGARSGAVSVVSNSPASPQSVQLTGTGADITISRLRRPSRPAGQSAGSASFDLSVASSVRGMAQLTCLSPQGSMCRLSASSVSLGDAAVTIAGTVTAKTSGRISDLVSENLAEPGTGRGGNSVGAPASKRTGSLRLAGGSISAISSARQSVWVNVRVTTPSGQSISRSVEVSLE